MSHKFLEPIKIGNQTVKNRVMFLAMAKNISNFDDSVSAKDIAYVESVAAGGVGLLVPGAMIVDPEWPSVLPLQPGIYDDRFIPGLRRLVLAAHKYDAKILFQLWHPGATNYSGIDPKTVDELTKDEIHAIQDKFVAAAKRAMAAGADGIEFQTCHGYLACQFISPLFNHRTDEYGWNKVEDRTRFATEILTRIRKVIGPDKIISVKMQGFDYPKSEGPNGNDGITPEQAAGAVQSGDWVDYDCSVRRRHNISSGRYYVRRCASCRRLEGSCCYHGQECCFRSRSSYRQHPSPGFRGSDHQ